MDKEIGDWTLRELMANPSAGSVVRQVWSWAREVGTITEDDPEAARFRSFGPGSRIEFPQLLLQNTDWISLGSNTEVGPFAVLSVGMIEGQDRLDTGPRGTEPIITIGERCGFGRYFQLIAHLHVEIGDVTWFAPDCFVTDQNHRYDLVDQPIHDQWPPESRPVSIGSGCSIGRNVTVLAGARIGRNTLVAANSVVARGEYPDFAVLAGSPAQVKRRYDPDSGWVPPRPVEAPTSR
ncbi:MULTISPECIES: acyltransferase [unclassified Crossiella]|uniref:acyltransferase n=1 Tax=unclassified Crossiella TaxID=2620835 RepID=UPI002000430B|nr:MULTISPECIES: acyltransferase [unclassified Crossiella]MCK2240057.1 acyltransferase [Crossiella sp. S99.2]MCK2252765.1 acyltransferase [Crossiella sp. S99.1]